MALPTSGTITMGMIRTELKQTGTISLGSSECRKLAGVSSGVIKMSDFYGKKNSVTYNNHIIYNKELFPQDQSVTITFPNKVISGTITVKINFKSSVAATGGSARDGSFTIFSTTITGTTSSYNITKTISVPVGTLSTTAVFKYLSDRPNSSYQLYKTSISISFTGEVEA